MSSPVVNPAPPQVPLNANLVNGTTYTTTFFGNNTFFNPSNDTVLQDIIAQAPDFLTSVSVITPTLANSSGSASFLSSVYSVTYTYEGDGSDVLNDVNNAIVAAALSNSNDNLSAGVTYQGPGITGTQVVTSAVVQTTGTVLAGASTVTQQAVNAVLAPASSAVNQSLIGILPVLAVIVLIILFVLPSFTKSAGSLKGSGIL